jgi:hypothetical protein
MSHFLNKLLYKSQYPDMTSALAGIVTPAKGGHRGKKGCYAKKYIPLFSKSKQSS